MNLNKKVHFYFPKQKIDVENQTLFDNFCHSFYENDIYEKQYQASINSLFDSEPPEKEFEKMIKFDYSSHITFYLTQLHDDRFEPLTPTNDVFLNSNPKLCLDIRNEGFILWNCSNATNNSDIQKNNLPPSLLFSFDNDANIVYMIIQSFITGRINSPMLRVIDKLQILYSPYGSILCEIIDHRFSPELTFFTSYDENVFRKRIHLEISNCSIYYLFSLANQAINRRRAVHLNTSNTENTKSSSTNKNSNASLTSHASLQNVSSDSSLPNSSNTNANLDSFHPIKRNESTPNLILKPNANAGQINHNQIRDDKTNNNFNSIQNDTSSLNPYQNDQNQMIINLQNKNFHNETYHNQINDYIQNSNKNLNIDPNLLQLNPTQNQNMKDNTFQISIQRMASMPIQTDTQPQIQPQLPQTPQTPNKQQLQKHLQQLQKAQSQQPFQKRMTNIKHKQQIQQQLQILQQQQQIQQQLQQQMQQQQLLQQQQIQKQPPPQIPQISQQSSFQQQVNPQNTVTLSVKQELPKSVTIKQEEPAPKSKSKAHSSASSQLNHPPQHNPFAGHETEAKLVTLIHPIFCTDPSPDVCRALSILDFRKKMWKETEPLFLDNFGQMKMHYHMNCNNNNNGFQQNRQPIHINPPKDKIVIPETISQLFISKNNQIRFNPY